MSSEERPQDLVRRGYDQVGDAYAALEQPGSDWPRLRRLRKLLDGLADGGRALDLGCGSGVPAMEAILERHRGVGADISSVQIERARARFPEAEFIESDMLALDFEAETFDAIMSFYAIEHLPREEHGRLFARLYAWLRPGGRLLFTLEPYNEPGRTSEWLGVEMFLSYHDPETTSSMLKAAGFVVEDVEIEAQLEGDRELEYAWFAARKPSASFPLT